jgi:hypothetical protein
MVVLHTAVTKHKMTLVFVMGVLVDYLEVITEHLEEIKEILQMELVELHYILVMAKVVTAEDQQILEQME